MIVDWIVLAGFSLEEAYEYERIIHKLNIGQEILYGMTRKEFLDYLQEEAYRQKKTKLYWKLGILPDCMIPDEEEG